MNPSPLCIRVLIVDDHPTLVWGLERLIASQFPEMQVVGSADSGDQALALTLRHSPDVVLLDLELGSQSGLAVLPQLIGQGAKVLVLTGERSQDVLDKAVRLGARGVLRKDAAAELVLKAIAKVSEGELWLDRMTLGRVLHGLMDPRADGRHDPEKHKQAGLTQRERKIIEVILEGRGASNKALASRLFISEHTLRNHLSSIYHKLGVRNRLELYVYALRHQMGANPTRPEGLAA
jgi:DNA-binding NarL/FixJ family response regulator